MAMPDQIIAFRPSAESSRRVDIDPNRSSCRPKMGRPGQVPQRHAAKESTTLVTSGSEIEDTLEFKDHIRCNLIQHSANHPGTRILRPTSLSPAAPEARLRSQKVASSVPDSTYKT